MKNFGFYTITNILLIKKLFSIFLVMAIFFNGFVPKSQEFKNNFLVAVSCAVATQTNFLDKYANTVVTITNTIATNILNTFKKTGLFEGNISKVKETANNKDKQSSKPVNTSSDNCIIIGNNTSNQNEISIIKAISSVLYFCNENLKYGSLKVDNELINNIGILFFILFSILVVRIKDTIAVLNNNKNIVINRLG